jgi:hypothetical protein
MCTPKASGTLVTVDAEDGTAGMVREVLNSHGAADVNTRGEEYRTSGWNRFDDKLEPYSPDQVRSYRDQSRSVTTTDTKPSSTGRTTY